MKSTILLAEDEVLQAISIQDYLKKHDYEVIIAINYKEAISFLDEMNIDIAILDIHLKGTKTGLDIGRYIQTNCPTLPIIFVTSYTDKQTLLEIKETGAVTFLSKPIKTIDLLVALDIIESNLRTKVLILKIGKQKYHLDLADICYIESEHIYIKIKNKIEQDLLIRHSIKSILKKLSSNFKQINRSVIINTDYITQHSDSEIMVADKVFKVSSSFKL